MLVVYEDHQRDLEVIEDNIEELLLDLLVVLLDCLAQIFIDRIYILIFHHVNDALYAALEIVAPQVRPPAFEVPKVQCDRSTSEQANLSILEFFGRHVMRLDLVVGLADGQLEERGLAAGLRPDNDDLALTG